MSLDLTKKIFILIPALNPSEEFEKYINELIENGFNNILVINDGSLEKYEKIFENIKIKKECNVISHKVNEGKGKAIKTGLKYFIENENMNDFIGVITADSDGQHLVKDIENIAKQMQENTNSLLLGTRDFSGENIPSKSSFGNKLTSKIFKTFYGTKISDTQTGLRGIPISLVKDFINIAGNRYEYETNMLIECILKKIPIVEIPIETVYINNNENTHFRPIHDSISIYWRIFNSFIKYSMISIISFVIDISLFKMFLVFVKLNFTETILILLATIFARIISSLINFLLNKKFSFNSNKKIKNTIVKYYILCVVQMIISGILVSTIFKLTGLSEVIIKLIVDTVLFIINFRIQRIYIFNE